MSDGDEQHHEHGHGHGPGQGPELPEDITELFTAEYWDERYGSQDAIWSGNPNRRLVEQVTGLAPGDALDVGCGEGADAIWLARQGWRVTAVDVSQVALDRGARDAATAGVDVTWRQVDAMTWAPEPDSYDLVSAQYVYLPPAQFAALVRGLAAAVRPGGSLLVVGHHPADLETTMNRPRVEGLEYYTAEDVAKHLDPVAWDVRVTDAPGRSATDPDGHEVTVRDAVLHAVRR